MKHSFIVVFLTTLLTTTTTAHWAWGQSGERHAAAEALFAEGRQLMEDKKYEAACQKFEASQKLDPGVGTLLNLANCYEQLGRAASAWARFKEAASAARAAHSPQREQLAQDRAEALESVVSRLTIQIEPGGPSPEDVSIQRNGIRVEPATLETAIPVDPGHHTIIASAPGYEPFETVVTVKPGGSTVEVTIPPLHQASKPAPSPAASAASANGKDTAKTSSPQRAAAVVAWSVGVVGAAVGTTGGLVALSEWQAAKSTCDDFPYECAPDADAQVNRAATWGDVSTAMFIVSAVGITTGTVLWLSAPRKERPVEIGLGPTNLSLRGRF